MAEMDDLEFQGFSSPEQNWYKMPNEFTELAASLVRRRMTARVNSNDNVTEQGVRTDGSLI